ncbi:hypothetical protein L9F63_027221, partial [Diploptera punctata]
AGEKTTANVLQQTSKQVVHLFSRDSLANILKFSKQRRNAENISNRKQQNIANPLMFTSFSNISSISE